MFSQLDQFRTELVHVGNSVPGGTLHYTGLGDEAFDQAQGIGRLARRFGQDDAIAGVPVTASEFSESTSAMNRSTIAICTGSTH